MISKIVQAERCLNRNILLLGEENSGKSTIFNRLVGNDKSLVCNIRGTTRDCLKEQIMLNGNTYTLCDLPGKRPRCQHEQDTAVNNLISSAMLDDKVALAYIVVDARYHYLHWIRSIIGALRKLKCPMVMILTHKDQLLHPGDYSPQFFASLGIEHHVFVDARKSSIHKLLQLTVEALAPVMDNSEMAKPEPIEDPEEPPRIAIIGRPNSGKSTMINALIGENRLITSPLPGTTTDCVQVPITYQNKRYILIDTAGCRKKQQHKSVLEKISTSDSYLLPILKRCDVVLLIVDGSESLTHQDMQLISLVFSKIQKTVFFAINKSDCSYFKKHKNFIISRILEYCRRIKQERIYPVSGKRGTGLKKLMNAITEFTELAKPKHNIPPRKVTFYLNQINEHKRRRNVKLKFARIVNWNPCNILICGVGIHNIDRQYKTYLVNAFRSKLSIPNMPINLIFKNA